MTTKRRIYSIGSEPEEWTQSPSRWEKEYRATIKCSKCLGPRKERPFGPIPQYVIKKPRSPFCLVMNTVPEIVSQEFAQAIEPFLSDVAWGPVYLERDDIIGPLNYRTYYCRPERCIPLRRSPFARHRLCECGVIIECNPNAKEAIVEYTLDGRLMYQSTMGVLLIDDALVRRLDLRNLFPQLDLWPIPIIDKPLDGDILPGDPGWNGTLVERPIEVPDLNSPLARKWSY